MGQYIDLSVEDVVKIHHFLTCEKQKVGGGHKSYSPTDVLTPGQLDSTIKLCLWQNSQLFEALQVGDSIAMSAPSSPPYMRAKQLTENHVNVVAFGVGITEAIEVVNRQMQNRKTPPRFVYSTPTDIEQTPSTKEASRYFAH